MLPPQKPHLIWAQRQRRVKFDFKLVRSIVEKALPFCAQKPRTSHHHLPAVTEITIVSDCVISKIHGDFLNDPTPTDVITFAHSDELGEILIGAETVMAQATTFHQPLEHEIARCIIHGLLHLLGYDDLTSEEHTLMHQQQELVLKRSLSTL